MEATILFRTNNNESIVELSKAIERLNERHAGKEVTYRLDIKQNRAIRSNDQNARYWAMLKTIALASGYDKDELHEAYKKKFNGKYVIDELIGKSTTGMDTKEFVAYCNQVEQHGKEFFKCSFAKPGDENYLVWMDQTDKEYINLYASI